MVVSALARVGVRRLSVLRTVRIASTSYLPPKAVPRAAAAFSTSHPLWRTTYTASTVTDSQYQNTANQVLDSLTESLETLVEEADLSKLGASRDWDVEYASGVLNLRCGHHGTWVVNKQPPNKQIWLSSPKSGPKRFDYDADAQTWFCAKEDQVYTLKEVLDTELEAVFATPVDLFTDN